MQLLHAYGTATEIKEQADMALRRNGIIINGKANLAIKVGNQQGQLLSTLAIKLLLCLSTWLWASSARQARRTAGGVRGRKLSSGSGKRHVAICPVVFTALYVVVWAVPNRRSVWFDESANTQRSHRLFRNPYLEIGVKPVKTG